MGRRTSAARSLPGNALGGVMRATQRQARAATRRVAAVSPEAEAAATPVVKSGPMATAAVTGPDGVAVWTFPEPLDETPAISATVFASQCATATVKWITTSAVAVTVWGEDGHPVEDGVPVYVVAFPR